MLRHLNTGYARHFSHLDGELRKLPPSWVIVHAKIELLLHKLVGIATFDWERLSEAERHAQREDVEPDPIMAVEQDVLVAAARIALRGRPRAERIPIVYCLILKIVNEVEKQPRGIELKEIQCLVLARIHI